ncbi:MAG: prepilin peptidase [Planctomycetaceae bacterium]|nr:prepilin peptidase [Planctomycetaceae bacterium]
MFASDPFLFSVLCVWLAVFGACVGSFLNVFLYRFPRRESLSYPPSHCPRCKAAIRWYDNVPVFGWIKLRGKCRSCKLPISIRYPCIEGFCGIVFCGIFVLLDVLFNFSVWPLLALTLFLSLSATVIFAVCCVMYLAFRKRIG